MKSRAKLTPEVLADFLNRNGRSVADVCDEFGGSYSGARKYLSLAVAAGFILTEKEKNLAFYTAAKKPKQMPPKFGGAVLDAPSASCHLNQVWDWVKPKPKSRRRIK